MRAVVWRGVGDIAVEEVADPKIQDPTDVPKLIELVLARAIDPARILTQREPLTDAVSAYQVFDTRQASWIKVELQMPH